MARSKEFDEKAVLRKAMELSGHRVMKNIHARFGGSYGNTPQEYIWYIWWQAFIVFSFLNHYEELIVNEMERIISSTSSIKQTIRDVFIFVLNSIEQYPKVVYQ